MASTATCSAVFTTQTSYPLPTQKFMIPVQWKRYHLSQLVNKALSLPVPIPFDFLIKGQLLQGSIESWCKENGVGEEETLDIEYIQSVMPPQKVSDLPHEDWVSGVSCKYSGHFITSSYDGSVRVFDYSQNLLSTTQVSDSSAPLTSVCVIPREDGLLVGTSSHDLTAKIVELPSNASKSGKAVASLVLHTSPVSSISSNSTGSHLLTASWDSLIGLWDTITPRVDEVDEPALAEAEGRRKRRKVADVGEKPKRKAPALVLKSHSSRVSRAVFSSIDSRKALSCGFDSTVRTWDVENGICISTITASEKPFLDIELTADGNTALVASTDRTVSLYDLRDSMAASTSSGSFSHPATPSCLALCASNGNQNQVLSGAYDGVVRLWDLRSLNMAVMTFKTAKGNKILGLDWKGGVAGIGGEDGLEVWKIE